MRLAQGALAPVDRVNVDGMGFVPLLVATTRTPSSIETGEMFDTTPSGQLSYASVTVSIPPAVLRRSGEVQWPNSVPPDPRTSFVTVAADFLDRQAFTSDLGSAASRNARGKVLVFVHGFNNRFDQAAFRFAQIVHDSHAPAVPVLFSWPSVGAANLGSYQEDLERANAAPPAIQQLLDTVERNPNVREITVLCHSMGCSPTVQALHARAQRTGGARTKIRNVMLVAPDVDVNAFLTSMQEIGKPRPRLVLFVAQDDIALKLSGSLRGGTTRLGQVNPHQEPYRSAFRRERIEVFDLTAMRGLAHSRAFREIDSVVAMLEDRFAQGQSMADNTLPSDRAADQRTQDPERAGK